GLIIMRGHVARENFTVRSTRLLYTF
uniref:Uncharacterized protein n=1 Tax=Amphimedon queenslandica TaxID=400682 RepID=A0A1X7U7V8_AMPQE